MLLTDLCRLLDWLLFVLLCERGRTIWGFSRFSGSLLMFDLWL